MESRPGISSITIIHRQLQGDWFPRLYVPDYENTDNTNLQSSSGNLLGFTHGQIRRALSQSIDVDKFTNPAQDGRIAWQVLGKPIEAMHKDRVLHT